MKPQPNRLPESFFDRLPETPITLKPHDPANKQRANAYGDQLNAFLTPLGVTARLFGSTELQVATKGEWEFAIYLTDQQWYPILTQLINHYHGIHNLEDDFALFADTCDGTEIEVIAMRGAAALRNQAFMEYMTTHPAACQEYEQGKRQHAHSKRAYYRWKDQFIASIIESL